MPTLLDHDDYSARYGDVCSLLEAFHAGIFDLDEAREYRVTSPQARAFALAIFELLEVGLTPEGEAASQAHQAKVLDVQSERIVSHLAACPGTSREELARAFPAMPNLREATLAVLLQTGAVEERHGLLYIPPGRLR